VQDDAAGWLVRRPTDRVAWDALLAGIPTADPLQSWAWADAGIATGERWVRLMATDVDERPVAAVQWQLVSPVLGHPLAYAPHGPVWLRDTSGAPGALRALMAGIQERARSDGASAILVDPRCGSPGEVGADPVPAVVELGYGPTERHVQMPSTRVLDLRAGVDASRASWDKDTRNLVRRAAREGVETEVASAADAAAVEHLHQLMVEVGSRGSFAPRSRAFLAAYGRSAGDRAFICLGHWQGRVIAGALVGLVGDRAYYQFAGSLREPGLRHANAAYGVMERVIGECVTRGAASLDLSGVNEKDDPTADPRWEGLSSFKRGFGGEPVRHPPVAMVVLRPGIERVRGFAQWVRGGLRGRRRSG
jgi:lipid II:glycine glycyltransferase (peptidoglycan interpeptide bridge formation enzyme)